MIIKCNNCYKQFDIAPSAIPEKGRLVQCSICNNTWIFKKEITDKSVLLSEVKKHIKVLETDKMQIEPYNVEINNVENESPLNINLQKKENEVSSKSIKIENKDQLLKTYRNKKNYNILNFTIVFIISFIAIIIILDTFQNPISKIMPNIEFLLNSLYETIYDIKLFFNDLI